MYPIEQFVQEPIDIYRSVIDWLELGLLEL